MAELRVIGHIHGMAVEVIEISLPTVVRLHGCAAEKLAINALDLG